MTDPDLVEHDGATKGRQEDLSSFVKRIGDMGKVSILNRNMFRLRMGADVFWSGEQF